MVRWPNLSSAVSVYLREHVCQDAEVETVIYARQSSDRTGQELGVTRQLEDARKLAKLRGWHVVAEMVDNDVSAAGKRHRPAFDAALRAVEEERARCLLAWDMTRLTRNSRDRLRLLEVGKAHHLTVAFVRGSDLDLSTPAGRLTADILGSVAQHEIEQKSDRQRRATQQAAAQGRRTGGRRPFGYEADGMTIREAEAAAVRAAYDDVLAGVPVARIARDWTSRGLYTPQSGYAHGCGDACGPRVRPRECPQHVLSGLPSKWITSSLRALLLNPRYAGLMSRVTEEMLVGTPPPIARLKGIVGPALWPALVGEETWRAAVDVLTHSMQVRGVVAGRALMTGVALCGVCRSTIQAGGAARPRGMVDKYSMYRCRGSMGHIGRAAGPVDWWVGELLIERLSRPDAAGLLVADDRPDAIALRRQASALRVRIDSLAKLFAEGVLTEVGVRRESEKLRAQLAEAERALTDAGRVNVLGPLIGSGDVRAAWAALDVDRRRAVVEALMNVTLMPPGRGTRYGKTVESWKANAERISASVEVEWVS